MSTIITIIIMCAIGYLAYVLFAESARVRAQPTSRRLRAKHTRALWIGGLIALSSVAAFFVVGGIADKLKPSLLLAALSLLLLAVVMKFTPRAGRNKFRRRWDRMMYGDMQPAEVNASAIAMHATATVSAKEQQQVTAAQNVAALQNNTHQNGAQPYRASELAAEPVVQAEVLPQPEVSETIAEQPLLDQATRNQVADNPAPANRELVDQAGHTEFIEMDIENEFPETGFVQHDQPAAANSGLFDSVVLPNTSNDRDEIVVDDFFDEVDGHTIPAAQARTLPTETDALASDITSEIEVATPVTPDVTQPPDSEGRRLADTTQNSVQDISGYALENTLENQNRDAGDAETHYASEAAAENNPRQDTYTQSNDAEKFFAEQSYAKSSYAQTEQLHTAGPDDEIPELPADATEIDQLAHAMNSVSGEAVKLQDSVSRINELHEQEQYYRTQLNGARLAYEKAQEAQFEAHAHDLSNEIKAGEKKLFSEQANRKNLEVNLEDKRRALLQAEIRVTELESELSARQQVFHDQMASLEKTKEMARSAAQLARRAAVMQQRAQTTALQERAKRERLEVSAKKAVNIARNAISKLAEEERKNSSSRDLH